MGWRYRYFATGDYTDFGGSSLFFQTGDMSASVWVNYTNPAPPNGQRIIQKDNTFFGLNSMVVASLHDATDGYGLSFGHIGGGSFEHYVNCIPGAVNPSYELSAGSWMYFGFSRDSLAATYTSYFGNRLVLIDGPSVPYTGITPIDGGGLFTVGLGSTNILVGPFTYWKRNLTRAEHVQIAQCNVDILDPDLLIFSKMFNPIADLSPHNWTPTEHGSPVYVPDQGCQSFGTGDDYRLYNA